MGKLADIVRKQSPYLKFADEETVHAVYKGFKLVPSTFDPEKETVRYMLEIVVDGEKLVKYWDNGSSSVAMAFDELAEGTEVNITKQVTKSAKGTKDKVSYIVTAGASTPEDQPEAEEESTDRPF